jgi:hypothetical protein
MSVLVPLLPVAVCGLMMWLCMRGMGRGRSSPSESAPTAQVGELRDEVARLRSELNAQPGAVDERSLDR